MIYAHLIFHNNEKSTTRTQDTRDDKQDRPALAGQWGRKFPKAKGTALVTNKSA